MLLQSLSSVCGTRFDRYTRRKKEYIDLSARVLVAPRSFLEKLYGGSKRLSEFSLDRRYSPSLLGLHKHIVTQDLIKSLVQSEATLALERISKYRLPGTVNKIA